MKQPYRVHGNAARRLASVNRPVPAGPLRRDHYGSGANFSVRSICRTASLVRELNDHTRAAWGCILPMGKILRARKMYWRGGPAMPELSTSPADFPGSARPNFQPSVCSKDRRSTHSSSLARNRSLAFRRQLATLRLQSRRSASMARFAIAVRCGCRPARGASWNLRRRDIFSPGWRSARAASANTL